MLLLQDRIKDVLSSSEDDDSVSYVSSKDAAEAQTNLYLTKIQKLEIELKKLKRENLAMRNSGTFQPCYVNVCTLTLMCPWPFL